ncbi:MAG: hypothetical protein KAJ12_00710, partial [Bacteroidetes bacterium]|nr:hypothetical protein [Bacteroidota bacterium]
MAFYGKRRTFDEFQTDLDAMLGGKAFNNFNFTFRPFLEQEFVRVQAQRSGQQEAPLIFDVMAGPRTPWGPSVSFRSRSGHESNVGPEIGWYDKEAGPEFFKPYENFPRYIKGAFHQDLIDMYPFEGRRQSLERVKTRGHAAGGLAGGLQGISKADPQWAQTDIASQIAIGLGGGIGQETAFRGIHERSIAAPEGDPWRQIVGQVPWRGGKDLLRMRRLGTAIQAGEEGDYAWDVFGLGAGTEKKLKHLNISMSMRQEAEVFGMEEGRGLVQMHPQEITAMGLMEQQGYKIANALLPGEDKPRSMMVHPGTLIPRRGTPTPGAFLQYQSASYETGVDAFGYGGTESFQLQIPHMARIRETKFSLGIHRQTKEGAWEKIRELEGYKIPAGASAVVGTYSVGDVTHPLRMPQSGGARILKGASLGLPPDWNIESGEGTPGMNRNPRTIQSIDPCLGDITRRFQEGGGGEVPAPYTSGGAYIDFGIGTETDASYKGAGWKMQGAEALGVSQLYKGDPVIGEQIRGITAEMKNPVSAFMNFVNFLPKREMAQMYGEFGGELGKQLEIQVAQHTAPGSKIDTENMASVWAHFRGQDYRRQHSVYQMFDELRQKANALDPEYSIPKYGRGVLKEGRWAPLHAESRAERMHNVQREYEGALLATGGEASGLAGHRLRRQQIRHRPIFQGPEGPTFEPQSGQKPELFMREQWAEPGDLITTAATPVIPEFRSKLPLIGAEEVASLSFAFPKSAELLGLSTSQDWEQTGVTPEFARGWREVGKVYRHQISERGMIPKGAIKLDDELRDKMRRAIFKMGGKKAPIGEISNWFAENVEGGVNPIVDPLTGEMIEHPASIEATSAFEYRDSETGQPLNMEARKFASGLLGLLGGETRMTKGSALAALASRREAIFKSKSRTAVKLAQGRFAPAVSSRYGYASGMQMGDEYLSTEQNWNLAE